MDGYLSNFSSKAEISENPSPRFFHLKIFKKLKGFKPFEPPPGVLGCFFFTVCLFLCLFLLDYSTVNKVPRLHQPSLFATWIGINGSSLPYNKSETVDFLGKGAESCDIFDGNWVWDESFPLYESKDCNFLDEGFRCSENGMPYRIQFLRLNAPRHDVRGFHLRSLLGPGFPFRWTSSIGILSPIYQPFFFYSSPSHHG
ncbi:protein trichome birefringence-like 10 [Solanum stenotomum]|uniref:protein trichome birefringence-like 10 n=1 Tax=Solanum stenotomum TaxID=172797 RepID=UPI0020D11938|nr:protein trichome birefringence-like 10 [Solanum stenotomum]